MSERDQALGRQPGRSTSLRRFMSFEYDKDGLPALVDVFALPPVTRTKNIPQKATNSVARVTKSLSKNGPVRAMGPEAIRARVRTDPFAGILVWDAGAERLFGWRADEALQETWFALVGLDPVVRIQGRRALDHHGRLAGVFAYVGKHGPITVATYVRQVSGGYEATFAQTNLPQSARRTTVTGITLASYQALGRGVGSPTVSSATTTNSKVGTRLRRAREKAGLTKYELAKRAGVNDGQVRQWEIGTHVPTAANLRRLIPHIGGSIEFYLFGDKVK